MTDIAALVRSLGGMAQKQQLVKRGARDLDLTRAVRDGEVIRARLGWYTTLPAGDPRVQAVRVGGRLTGISAIAAQGGWVLGSHDLHVSVHDNAARLRTSANRHRRLDVSAPAGVALHWDAKDVAGRGTATLVSLRDALHRVMLDESAERAIAAVDWALCTGRIDMFDVESLLLGIPAARRIPSDWFDEKCESLPESLTRTRLRCAGHRVRSQVPMATGEFIDLLVDDVVGIEVDGDEFHRDTFLRDRRKDLHATADEKLHVLRPAAASVFSEWPLVLAAVETALTNRRAFEDSGTGLPNRLKAQRKTPTRRGSPESPKGGPGMRGGGVALNSG